MVDMIVYGGKEWVDKRTVLAKVPEGVFIGETTSREKTPVAMVPKEAYNDQFWFSTGIRVSVGTVEVYNELCFRGFDASGTAAVNSNVYVTNGENIIIPPDGTEQEISVFVSRGNNAKSAYKGTLTLDGTTVTLHIMQNSSDAKVNMSVWQLITPTEEERSHVIK